MAEVAKDGQLSGSATSIFDVPANQVLIITSLTIKDASGAANTVHIHIDNGGAAAGAANRLQTIELEADEARSVGEAQGKRVAQGGKLYIDPTSGATNYFLSGRTVTQTQDAEDVG